MKKLAILGSTGSIGENTLNMARHAPEEIKIVGLAAKSNIDLLEKQAKEFHPLLIGVYDVEKARELQKRIPHITVLGGMEGVQAVAAQQEANFVVSAMTGTLGLLPTLTAIQAGKDMGLANKEALVSGGALVMALAKKNNVNILPIDSEHSAIFQCLNGEDPATIKRIILTASGGPFRTLSREELSKVTVDQALCHPTWKMGPKVTIDSSTLMNKGLEVIEAHWLFNTPLEKIDVVIHPQSIIHSMVEFNDNSIMAQMGVSNMIGPIQYAVNYPRRKPGLLAPFDFFKNSTLQFYAHDLEKFPCLKIAYQAAKAGGSLTCYMNAANEVLVSRCLAKQILWHEIAQKLDALLSSHQSRDLHSVEEVLEIDARARSDASMQ